MMVLSLVRSYLPSHQVAVEGGWNIADCVARGYDVEDMHFGTPIREEYLIVDSGVLAGTGANSYKLT
jgi:hypothetical protein